MKNAEGILRAPRGLRRRHSSMHREGGRLLLLLLPCLLIVFVFSYLPLWGWAYAFFQYKPGRPLSECEFVGLKNFTYLFSNPVMRQRLFEVLRNTFAIHGIGYLFSPLSAIFAIFLNEMHSSKIRRVVQTVSTLPYFISWVIMYAREYYGTEDGELSILPFGVGKNTLYAAADTDRYAIKLNYQLYEQIGAPEFEKLEDVIPILKEMQQAYPQNEEGMNVYAMNLFSDFDTTHFFNMMSIYSILGYHWNYLPYGIEYEIETGTPYSIFREDSVYRRGARFMYELNQQGLLDPDSLTQERATADKKVSSKASVAGWAGVPGWAGKGYLPVPFDEFKPSLVTEEPYGKVGIAISANAENVDTCLKFVDMLADYDALLTLYNGPQGDRWDIKDGKLVMTDKFKEYLEAGGGTYVLENGEEYSLFNIVSYIPNMGNTIEKYGEPFPMTLWTEYVDRQYETEDAQAWSARYGYKYLKDLLEAENKMTAVMDTSFVPFLTPDSDDMKLTLAALKDVIVPSTWELIYAKDDAEFEQIWSRMKQNAEALGLEDVISYKVEDIAQAKETAKQFK